MPDELTSASDLTVELTDSPDYDADLATAVPFTTGDGRLEMDGVTLDAGDHYVWLTTGDQRVPETVTIPAIAPRVWLDGDVPTIQFDEAADSSWSSYVDPEGKAVYRSASAVFDDTATQLRDKLAITETSLRVDDPDPELPYYYLVFTGRGGDSTFVSSPLFADATQGPLHVELRDDATGPTYVISGFLAARQDAVDRTQRLRVGTFDANNPASTFFVENTATGGAPGAFEFDVPATQLAPGYDDLAVFLSEDGATLDGKLSVS